MGTSPTRCPCSRAAAVAGERGLIEDLAALSGTSVGGARTGLHRLVEAGILQPGGGAFVHPLVRAATLEATPYPRRMELHGEMARQLRAGRTCDRSRLRSGHARTANGLG